MKTTVTGTKTSFATFQNKTLDLLVLHAAFEHVCPTPAFAVTYAASEHICTVLPRRVFPAVSCAVLHSSCLQHPMLPLAGHVCSAAACAVFGRVCHTAAYAACGHLRVQ